MRFGLIAIDRQTSAIAHRNGESRVRKRLPPIRVVDDVTNRAFAVYAWDAPIQTNTISRPAFVFAEWIRGRTDKSTVRWQ